MTNVLKANKWDFKNKRALRAETIEEGKKEGILCILVEMVKDKVLSVAEAAKRLGVSEVEFTKLAKA